MSTRRGFAVEPAAAPRRGQYLLAPPPAGRDDLKDP